ncbi:DNA-protecting protein DprA [bacterium]|nr:DNA-protecting protein DprA [bacterium]
MAPEEFDSVIHLLDRGLSLSEAIERWGTRGIWVVGRDDPDYPARLRTRLRSHAPLLLYGSGCIGALGCGGLAIVGSRNATSDVAQCAEFVGHLAGRARIPILSGGARGVDQLAMRSGLATGGTAIGVLADSLEKACLQSDNRRFLETEALVLTSQFAPEAGFNVGSAMARNKVIYALADAALIVRSDFETGGTWAGAIEQLRRYKSVPVFVAQRPADQRAVEALISYGAQPWPPVSTVEELSALIAAPRHEESSSKRGGLTDEANLSAAVLLETVSSLITPMPKPRKPAEIASELGVMEAQARKWLEQLTERGTLARIERPVRYFTQERQPALL